MNCSITQLDLLLQSRRWREANESTRLLLPERNTDASFVREVDECWSRSSQGKFGFLEQRRRWASLGGPALVPGVALWDFFRSFGDDVGWRRDGGWISWAGVVENPLWPVLDADDIPQRVPRGCLPFHDVMSSGRWQREFSPRDCWGEHVWNRWSGLLNVF